MIVELVKTEAGTLAPGDEGAAKRVNKLAAGEVVLAEIRRPRNLAFHRKMFKLFTLAFNNWEPPPTFMGVAIARKSFETFREELTIAAGHYHIDLSLDGTPRLRAKSLKFDRMNEEEFREVYEGVVAVLTTGILKGMTKEAAQRLSDLVLQERF